MPAPTIRTLRDEFSWLVQRSKTRRIRTMREFAEQEIVLPEGPFENRRLRVHRQPYAGHVLDAMDDTRWNRFAFYGCVQSGKTLNTFVIPLLYHLFEVREKVICGVPTMEVAHDKWVEEILPVIMKTRFKRLLPTKGRGSKGGLFNSIKFTNGVTLKFMTGRGKDEKRSGFTSRVVVVTEADKFDEAADNSDETDPIGQLEARTEAFGDNARIYLECTVSVEKGCIHREWSSGSAGDIVCRCPHCKQWVQPNRDCLVGWQDSEEELDAKDNAYFCCPGTEYQKCGQKITEDERKTMVANSIVLHRGQTIGDDGASVVGDFPRTATCGLRWHAFHNMFWSAGHIARREWHAAYDADGADIDGPEKYLSQFVWSRPWIPPEWDVVDLNARDIARRTQFAERGVVPSGFDVVTVGCDLGKRCGHWIAFAWKKSDGTAHVVEYATFDVPSDSMGIEKAMIASLRTFGEDMLKGFRSDDGDRMLPQYVFIDSRYYSDQVFLFCREQQAKHDRLFVPTMGMGYGKQYPGAYHEPKSTKGDVVLAPPNAHYHVVWRENDRVYVVMVDADRWKTFLHERLATPIGAPGACSLYDSRDRSEHVSLSKHFTSEKQVEEFIDKRGLVKHWVRMQRSNHWFDGAYNACVAGHLAGVRVVRSNRKKTPIEVGRRGGITGPNGSYLVTAR